MKRIISFFAAVFILVSALSCAVFASQLTTDAKFEDGFSNDSGKLCVTVTNDSGYETLADVTISLTLPEGASVNDASANLGEILPGESASKDFMLNFAAPSIFEQYKFIFIFGGIAFALLIAIAFVLLRRSRRGAAIVLAVAMLPAVVVSSRAVVMRKQDFELTHDGKKYSVSILVTAEKADGADSAIDETQFGQNGDAAPSRPLKSTRPTDPNEDYNTPKVARGRIKEGAGPLTENGIYIGTNEFMFLGEETDYISGESILSDKAISHIAERLVSIDEWAKEHGIDFYLLICPNKSTVYADYVPDKVKKADVTSRDLLVAYLEKNTSVKYVDSTDAVIAARERFGDELFFKYDTHWTQHAGHAAYWELMKKICADHPEAKAYPAGMFNVTEYETYMKDNAYYLGYYDEFTDFGPVYSLKVGPEATMTENGGGSSHGQFRFCNHWETGFREDLKFVCFESVNPDAPGAYILRDSFSIAMFPFLKESFSTSAFDWSYSCKADDILSRGAKVLVLEVVERSLGELASARVTE